jgi:hypothetical protein
VNVRIELVQEEMQGRIVGSHDLPPHAWNRVKEAILAFEPEARIVGRAIQAEWRTVLNAIPELSRLRDRFAFETSYDDPARSQLVRYRSETIAIRAAQGTLHAKLGAREAVDRLASLGFTRRVLTDEQERDLLKMVALPHGANFSVPGAGKTTVALAAHLLTRTSDTFLLVVAPKNAFVAWDEVIEECLDPDHPEVDVTPFVRLSGTPDQIRDTLTRDAIPKRLIMSYDQLIRSARLLVPFLTRHRVHLILDESHRIKAGQASQRGSSSLSLAPLATRRDVMSGTPVPNRIEDVVPQVEFLWPGQGLGQRVVASGRPHDVLGPLYARTTKRELGLGPVDREFVPIEMSAPQVALYGVVRSELLKRSAGIRAGSSVDLESARRSVMRLLQISSNPLLVVRRLTGDEPETYLYEDKTVEAIFLSVYEEGDSPKIRRACELARQLAVEGRKSVIWTAFTGNVERLAHLLADLEATFIHGGVDTGLVSDPDTREGRLKRFNDPKSQCMVLVANPAAGGEGISLHHVCHDAIYVDRSFNAAHYLQSVDRIHRLGLPPDVVTHVRVLESVAPHGMGSIDYSVRRRLVEKLRVMSTVLNDPDLHELMLEEDEAEPPVDWDVSVDDILDVIRELKGEASPPETDEP